MADVSNETRLRIAELVEVSRQKKEIEAKEASLKALIAEDFKSIGIDLYEDNSAIITVRDASVRQDFDSKRFKLEHEDLFKQYTKTTNVKASVAVKIKG